MIQTEGATVQVPAFETQKARLMAELQKAKTENAYTDTINSLNELVVSSDALDVVAEEVKTAKVESVNGLTLAAPASCFKPAICQS